MGRRVIVWRWNKETQSLELKPARKRWSGAVSVPIADIFALGRRRQVLQKTRDKQAIKRAVRKLRRAAKHGEQGDGVDVLTERELFLLSGAGRGAIS